MGFVQIIEYRTSKIDEMQKVGEEWEQAAAGSSKARRRVLCRDLEQPDRYLNIVFFDSQEEANENSALPATDQFASKMAALADGPPTFHNLDVVEDRG